jgi:hypothetical protein
MTKTLSQKLRRRQQRNQPQRGRGRGRTIRNNNNIRTRIQSATRRGNMLNNLVRRPQNPPKSRSILGELGQSVGGFFGLPRVGRAVGTGISRIFGSGDYVVTPPSAIRSNSLAGTSPPTFGNASGSARIRHREFVADIQSSTDFSLQSYPLNPGMSNLFPWLSQVARCYEQYHIHGLCIEFKSTSGWAVSSTNTALGVVGCVTQYDASDADFTSKQQAENYQGCQNTSPAHSILHFVECAVGSNPLDKLYIRNSALAANQDVKMYDMGKFSIFRVGSQAVTTVGELWVSYDVELSKPKLPDSSSVETSMDYYRIEGVTSPGSVNSPFGAAFVGPMNPVRSRLGSFLSKVSGNHRINFPSGVFSKGWYVCSMNYTRTSGTVGNFVVGAWSGANGIVNGTGFNGGVSIKAGPGTNGNAVYNFIFQVNDSYTNGIVNTPHLNFTTWAVFDDIYNLDLYIFPVNSNYALPAFSLIGIEQQLKQLQDMMRSIGKPIIPIQEVEEDDEWEEKL